jgi:putative membrane protein
MQWIIFIRKILSALQCRTTEKEMKDNEARILKSSESNRERLAKYLVYFAAERTLMAWIRSALGLMALGFVIDRFGLVLRQVLPGTPTATPPSSFSFWAGAALVITGALMAAVGAGRYLGFAIRYHRDGNSDPGYGLVPAIFFIVAVAFAGVIIVAFLLEEFG